MISDNIKLRLRINNYIDGILEQTNQKLEKYVSTYKKRAEQKNIFFKTAGGTTKTDGDEEEAKKSEFDKRKQQRVIEFKEKK